MAKDKWRSHCWQIQLKDDSFFGMQSFTLCKDAERPHFFVAEQLVCA